MREQLTVMLVALLMAGCMSEIYEGAIPVVLEIDLDDNETRDKIIAEAIDHEKLQANFASDRRGGKYYAPNQQKPYTGWSKSMHDNGQMMALWHFKDGKADGLWTKWFDNGQKKEKITYKDGKLVTAVSWKPNGDKCPVTNVVDGNGVWVWYNPDGTESGRNTYKDGEVVRELK
jgi:antitoxin component YwqK of YwqJK toxin-antitoxin module